MLLPMRRPSAFNLPTAAIVITVSAFFLYSGSWRFRDSTSASIVTDELLPAVVASTLSVPTETPSSVAAIPERLWYKTGPKGLSETTLEWVNTCLDRNPSYQSTILTDDTADLFVREHFASRLDIVETYLALPFPILKADLLRYLLLYSEGGIWNDLDVSCEETPISDWIPSQYKKDANLVVGWEFDVGWGDNFVRQFVSWTVMAKSGSPHLFMVIDNIIGDLHRKSEEHNASIADLTLDMIGDIVDLTGPRQLTRSIINSLNPNPNETFDEDSISHLMEPKLVGDVLILPGYSFAASSNHYEEEKGPVLVTHHYAGSWKNDHGGETV